MTLSFVGRRQQLEQVLRTLTFRGDSSLLITGEAGVGKTSLLHQAADRAAAEGVAVHRVTATQATAGVPYGAMAHLVPSAGFAPEPASLVQATHSWLAAEGRTALVVDDLPLLDSGSTALLHHLLLAESPAVVATARTASPADDEPWWRRLPMGHLELSPLDAAAVTETLQHTLDGLVGSQLLERLNRLSEGNPMLLTELVNAALESGAIERRDGVWHQSGPLVDAATLPTIVAARIDRLPTDLRAAAELVALCEPVSAELLEALLTPDVIARLEEERLLTAREEGRRRGIGLAHPLYAECLRATAPPLRARRHHRRLAEALTHTGARRQGDRVRLAVWRLEAGIHDDPDLLLEAAGRAARAFDHDLAARLALAAHDAGGGLRARLALLSARAHQGAAGEAVSEAAELAKSAPDDASRVRIARVRADLHLALGQGRLADQVLSETRAHVSSSTARWQLLIRQCTTAFSVGDVGRAVAIGDGLAAGSPDPETAVALTPAVVRPLACAGRTLDGLAIADRALAHLEGSSSSETAFVEHVRMARAHALAYTGRLHDAMAAEGQAAGADPEGTGETIHPLWQHDLGQGHLLAGRPRSARTRLLQLLSGGVDGLAAMVRLWVLDALAEAAALLGQPEEAADRIRRLDASRTGEVVPVRRNGHVWAIAAGGEHARACNLARQHAEALGRNGAHFLQAMLLHDAARLGAARDVVPDLAAATSRCQGPLAPLLARNAAALADEDPDELDTVASELQLCGYDLLACEAVSAAAGWHHESGRPALAMRATERRRELLARCEGARTPLTQQARGHASPLTRREREVAGLAAGGLTDREIAERLTISPRTVHSHLHRVYTKLAIEGREELGAALGDPRTDEQTDAP